MRRELIKSSECFKKVLVVVIVIEFVFDGLERRGRAQGFIVKVF
jgi:hypothetical protein